MAKNVANTNIGPAHVYLDAVDLGHTMGGVAITFAREFTPLKVDQYGNTDVEAALLGENFKAECNIAEITITNLKKLITGSQLSTSGGDSMLKLGTDAGQLQAQFGGELHIHPINKTASDHSGDWVIYKVTVKADITDEMTPDKQRVWKATFSGLIDERKSSGNRLGHYGTHIS